MTRRLGGRTLVLLGALCTGLPVPGIAQTCPVPDSVQGMIPADPPVAVPYATQWVTGAEGQAVALGVGHLHTSYRDSAADLPTGPDDWLRRVTLPLSPAPDVKPSAWIAGGWILEAGAVREPLSWGGLIETGYEEVSFVVLEARPDGWLRIRFALGEGGTAWTQRCYLSAGPVALEFTEWGSWLTSGNLSPLFFRADAPGRLHSSPDSEATQAQIAADYMLEPLEIRGEWMRVRVSEPSDHCEPDVEPTRREGWVRWVSPEWGPLLWYHTRGC